MERFHSKLSSVFKFKSGRDWAGRRALLWQETSNRGILTKCHFKNGHSVTNFIIGLQLSDPMLIRSLHYPNLSHVSQHLGKSLELITAMRLIIWAPQLSWLILFFGLGVVRAHKLCSNYLLVHAKNWLLACFSIHHLAGFVNKWWLSRE